MEMRIMSCAGYGMHGDFQSLDATHTAFRGVELCNVIDLCEVHKQVQSVLMSFPLLTFVLGQSQDSVPT